MASIENAKLSSVHTRFGLHMVIQQKYKEHLKNNRYE